MRVITLLPSATEIVCALGLESSLVGRSHECDFPASIRKLPSVTKPSFNPHGTRQEIDVDKIKALKPDFIITHDHCEGFTGVKIISLNATSLSSVWDDFENVAHALGHSGRGKTVAGRLRDQMEHISQQAKQLDERPRVACIEWVDPLMAAGNWVPELVDLAGGFNLFGEAGAHSPWIAWERVAEKDPDYLLVMPCGFDIDRTRHEMGPLLRKKEWPDLQAVYNNRVYLLDGNQYFNRPGPRLLESLEILVEVLHPETFDFEQKMSGWQYL